MLSKHWPKLDSLERLGQYMIEVSSIQLIEYQECVGVKQLVDGYNYFINVTSTSPIATCSTASMNAEPTTLPVFGPSDLQIGINSNVPSLSFHPAYLSLEDPFRWKEFQRMSFSQKSQKNWSLLVAPILLKWSNCLAY